MHQEISIEHNGITVEAEYSVEGDKLFVYLPNGEVRQTELRGLDPKSAALPHLKGYAIKNS